MTSFSSYIPKSITRNLINIPGWRTKRRIVVIESDDWGSIKMASKEAYDYFLKIGYPVDQNPYNRFDSLESNDDLESLFQVLSSVKDKNGHPAIVTANALVANPDFDKIENDKYQFYHYETFLDTLNRYPNHDRVYNLYKEGIQNLLIRPQLHGREHLNVPLWMESLQDMSSSSHKAFKWKMYSVREDTQSINFNDYTDALAFHEVNHLEMQHELLTESLDLFKKIWGYNSKSFIAPCYIWSSEIEDTLHQGGVRYLQGMINQFMPIVGTPYEYKLKYHYMGQRNILGQRYIIRNVFFEPSHTPKLDNVGLCLQRIETSFRWNKPAVISSHRLNYMGELDPLNRERGLKQLSTLLKQIVKRWPDVEFMSTDQLGDLMEGVNQ